MIIYLVYSQHSLVQFQQGHLSECYSDSPLYSDFLLLLLVCPKTYSSFFTEKIAKTSSQQL